MADDEAWQYWRSVMGDSDDDFEGFTLRDIVKGDESDIDFDTCSESTAHPAVQSRNFQQF